METQSCAATATAAATTASAGAMAAGTGVAAGAAGAAKGSIFGRSITSWIRDGLDEEVAIINAIGTQDIEMAEDIERTMWINPGSVGSKLESGLPPIIEAMVQDPDYTKTQMMQALSALPGDIVKESALLSHLIDKLILEVTMGVPEDEQSPWGSLPYEPGEEEEEEDAEAEDDEEEVDATRAGARGRRGGGAEAALGAGAAADVVAARGAPGTYSRQKGRTQRTQARQGGRTERAYQRQGSRAERRGQRGERQAARGERRADRRAARADRGGILRRRG